MIRRRLIFSYCRPANYRRPTAPLFPGVPEELRPAVPQPVRGCVQRHHRGPRPHPRPPPPEAEGGLPPEQVTQAGTEQIGAISTDPYSFRLRVIEKSTSIF